LGSWNLTIAPPSKRRRGRATKKPSTSKAQRGHATKKSSTSNATPSSATAAATSGTSSPIPHASTTATVGRRSSARFGDNYTHGVINMRKST
ncbi:hypothetical protein BDN72DRAFT_907473, partial [Pluteus cervinus]